MKLIAGLGNPGTRYAATRHNIGFMVIERLAGEEAVCSRNSLRYKSAVAKLRKQGKEALLVRPLTYMNNSGVSIKSLMGKYRIDRHDLLVICDDMDLPLGRIRFRTRGKDGGHLGMRSIIEQLDSDEVARLRVGIGKPPAAAEAKDFVLSEFKEEEKETLRESIKISVFTCKEWLFCGISKNITYTVP